MPPDRRTSSPKSPPSQMPVFSWLLCEPLLIGSRPKAKLYFIFLFFCRSICHPQTIIRRPPHTFRHNWVSSIMIPSPLTPTFGWLLRLTSKQRPPKPEIPFLSLFFEGSCYGAPSKGPAVAIMHPPPGACCGPWGVTAPRFGGATALPMEREGKAAGG